MIVRISGEGQYELDDEATHHLDALDNQLMEALNANDADRFHQFLHAAISFVQSSGTPVPHERIVPSQVVIPPDDVTLEEAHRFFTDEGLMEPLPA